MKTHERILRQIASQDLDPSVAYVPGKGDRFIPEEPSLRVPDDRPTTVPDDEDVVATPQVVVDTIPVAKPDEVERLPDDLAPFETVKQPTAETAVETNVSSEDKQTSDLSLESEPKKKNPFKKKTTAVSE